MENRDTCIFYRSYFEAMKDLPKDVQADVYNAIFDYSLNFIEHDLTGLAKTIFTLIKPVLAKGNQNYANGKKAKTKKQISESEAELKQTESDSQGYKYKYKDKDKNKHKEDKIVDKQLSFKNKSNDSFKKELSDYVQEYGKEMILSFHSYWSEPLANGKMRLTGEKAWDLSRRLKTWQSRSIQNNQNNLNVKQVKPFSRASNGGHYVGDKIINNQ